MYYVDLTLMLFTAAIADYYLY